ncbi:MAG: phosphatidylglycerophosphatase A [Candidatus Omnitrophota bacterium]
MKRLLTKLAGTFFFFGEMPWFPGTWGSLAGLLLYLALGPEGGIGHLAVFASLALAGFLLAGPASAIFGKKDAKPVVIDEVAGIFLVFWGIRPSLLFFVLGFILYRLLDIVKPFPARRLEKVPGSAGIMLDDLVCGVYANLLLRVLACFYQGS